MGIVNTCENEKEWSEWFMWNHNVKFGTEWHDPCCYSLFTFNELFYIYENFRDVSLILAMVKNCAVLTVNIHI